MKRICKWICRLFRKPKPKAPIRPILMGTKCPLGTSLDYTQLLVSVETEPMHQWLIDLLKESRYRFEAVEDVTFVPWQVIAFITLREAGVEWGSKPDFKWDRCLHNGDRWDRETTHVPKGLGPWRSWEASAADAMNRRRRPESWSPINTLWFLEQYNGLGYRKYHSHVKSPYIWGKSNRYTKGGYAADGKWSDNYVNKQIGAVAFLTEFGFFDRNQS